MIDVVFLLLVFFMLAARFGHDYALPLATSGTAKTYEGPPRLVTVTGDDLALNGSPVTSELLVTHLHEMTAAHSATVFLQPRATTDVQQIIDVIDLLRAAGFTSVVVVPAP